MAESELLRSEIHRLKQALESQRASSQQYQQDILRLSHELEAAVSKSKTFERQAISIVTSRDENREQLALLQREVSTKSAEVRHLEDELRLRGEAHAARIADMQSTFQQKILDLRKAHTDQIKHLQDTAEQHKTALELLMSKTKQETEQITSKISNESVKELHQKQAKIDQLAQQVHHLEQEMQSLKKQLEQQKEVNYKIEQECHQLQAELLERTQQEKSSNNIDMSVVALMEQQLGNLSSIIRAKESELGELRATFTAVCEERRQLRQHVEELEKAAGAQRTAHTQSVENSPMKKVANRYTGSAGLLPKGNIAR